MTANGRRTAVAAGCGHDGDGWNGWNYDTTLPQHWLGRITDDTQFCYCAQNSLPRSSVHHKS